jgi:aryl-alcohol dehydrogenase-like predicted oxidoreductase
MEYRRMGRTGLKVSEFCLGTMTFGHGADEAEAKRMVDLALDAGVNFFDTADGYSSGQAELMLGKALKGRRRDVVLATKFFTPMGPGPNDSGMSRVHVMNAIEDSLRRLDTDWVDLYYMHHVDVQAPLEEMLRAMDDLVRQGKVRYPAVSNYEAWRICEALWLSDKHNLARFECCQHQYNLAVRDIEHEILPFCRDKGLGMVVWSPLAGGFLTGKYRPGERVMAGTRSEEKWAYPTQHFAPSADETLKTLTDAATEMGRSSSQVALRWVLDQAGVTSAIVGARKVVQLEENLKISGWHLPDSIATRLNQVSVLAERYPVSMEKTMSDRRDRAVKMPVHIK